MNPLHEMSDGPYPMSNGEYFLAQFGNRLERKRSRSMLLDVGDLPTGNWRILGDRRWRTGAMGERGELAERARKAGSFTAWRSFRLEANRKGFWTEVISYANKSDAEAAVPLHRASLVKNPKFKGTVTEDRVFDDFSIPGVSVSMVSERSNVTDQGLGSTRFAAGCVGRTYFVVACSQRGSYWSWEEVSSIAALQADKIRKFVGASDTEV
jgi:hypothetical protein